MEKPKLSFETAPPSLVRERVANFTNSILNELHKLKTQPVSLSEFITTIWEKGFYKGNWEELIAEYNSIKNETAWQKAFDSKSDKLIIQTWIIFGDPSQMNSGQREIYQKAISRFGALVRIRWERNNPTKSYSTNRIEVILSPLLDNSDLILSENKQ